MKKRRVTKKSYELFSNKKKDWNFWLFKIFPVFLMFVSLYFFAYAYFNYGGTNENYNGELGSIDVNQGLILMFVVIAIVVVLVILVHFKKDKNKKESKRLVLKKRKR